MEIAKNKRLEWVDIFKAISIILVVIGHATGRFNNYIYQFHVPAFFFISGYLSNIDKKSSDELIIKKFFSLILPYLFYCTIGLLIFAILQKYGVLNFVSSWNEIPPLNDNLKTIFTAMYCDWFGALWFLPALFVAYFISKMCLNISNNKFSIMFILLSFFLFKIGYFYHYSEMNPTYISSISLFLISQFYFVCGFIFNKISNIVKIRILKNKKVIFLCLLLLINILLMYYFKQNNYVMDVVSVSVNTPFIDLIMALNGVSFLYCISNLISLIRFKKIINVFTYIGKNTMGILIFHFIGFKIVTLMLSLINVCSIEQISLLCPLSEVSYNWWPLYLIISVTFSLMLWNLVKKFKTLSYLSGNETDKYNSICEKFKNMGDTNVKENI